MMANEKIVIKNSNAQVYIKIRAKFAALAQLNII